MRTNKKKRKVFPKIRYYFLHLITVAALKFLVLPKYFLVTARKIIIFPKFWKLGEEKEQVRLCALLIKQNLSVPAIFNLECHENNSEQKNKQLTNKQTSQQKYFKKVFFLNCVTFTNPIIHIDTSSTLRNRARTPV